jgi:hypothetical protein
MHKQVSYINGLMKRARKAIDSEKTIEKGTGIAPIPFPCKKPKRFPR